jgi:hypothetical protein
MAGAGRRYREGGELDVWVLVVDAFLERAHGVLGRNRLAADLVGNLEAEEHVLGARRQRLGRCSSCAHRVSKRHSRNGKQRQGPRTDLLVKRIAGRPPACHRGKLLHTNPAGLSQLLGCCCPGCWFHRAACRGSVESRGGRSNMPRMSEQVLK